MQASIRYGFGLRSVTPQAINSDNPMRLMIVGGSGANYNATAGALRVTIQLAPFSVTRSIRGKQS